MITFKVNGIEQRFDGDPDMPLLWYLREDAKLKGTKYGCGIGQCGACTVHVNGNVMRSCSLPMAGLAGASVVTIEGLAEGDALHVVQQAWLAEDVAQCGYCQAGQIMAATALLSRIPRPTDADIDTNIGNICRCATYNRVRKAIHRAAEMLAATAAQKEAAHD